MIITVLISILLFGIIIFIHELGHFLTARRYNVTVDEIICGHLHRPESKSVGIADVGDKIITRVGSICGVDPYAKKVRCAARPSCYFALYDEENGKTWSRNYYL